MGCQLHLLTALMIAKHSSPLRAYGQMPGPGLGSHKDLT